MSIIFLILWYLLIFTLWLAVIRALKQETENLGDYILGIAIATIIAVFIALIPNFIDTGIASLLELFKRLFKAKN